MAKFQFNCPQCGQLVKADETWRGQDGECPYCGKGIVVPRHNAQVCVLQKGDKNVPILTRAKARAITAKNKVVAVWKSGTKGMVILCVPTLLTLGTIVSLMYFMPADQRNAEAQSQGKNNYHDDKARTNDSFGGPRISRQVAAVQAWDIDFLRRAHSKPMSSDQEVYNNLLYLYLSLQDNYSNYKDVKKVVYEFDHTKLTPDMKDFVSEFVTLLDKIGEIERRIDNCQDDRERERNDSSVSSGFNGGFKAASTLSQFDSGGDDGFGAGTYLLAGLIGGAIEASENDSRIKEKYKRIVQEYKEKENGLYIEFWQDINKLRNSEAYKTFDKDRLLPEDVMSSIKEDSFQTLKLIQCKVPELSFQILLSNIGSVEKQPEVAKKHVITCIANYPQSLNATRKTVVSVYYSILSYVVLLENVLKIIPGENIDIESMLEAMSPTEFAAIAIDPIAILDEGIKHDSGNHNAFDFRAALRGRSGDSNGALADINNAIRISPEKSYFYNKACILAKEFKDARGAKAAIREAFKKGFCDIKKLKADKNLAILQGDSEFLEMTKVKFSWWYNKGIMYSEIFIKNESCFRLTNVRLVSSCGSWRWSLPESGTVMLDPWETFSKDWYDNPPSYAQTQAVLYCDQNTTR